MKGAASASFRGSLDAVAIHREIVSDAELKTRFRRKGGPVVGKAAPAVKLTPQQRMGDCNKKATGKKGDERKAFMSSCLKG